MVYGMRKSPVLLVVSIIIQIVGMKSLDFKGWTWGKMKIALDLADFDVAFNVATFMGLL
jgi:hypothetical protein